MDESAVEMPTRRPIRVRARPSSGSLSGDAAASPAARPSKTGSAADGNGTGALSLPPPRSYFSRLTAQLSALILKNFIILHRRTVTVLFLLFVPALFVLFVHLAYSAINTSPTQDVTIATPERCRTYTVYGERVDDPNCITMAFAPLTPVTESIMRHVADNSGLVYNDDIVPFASADDVSARVHQQLVEHTTTDAAIIFNSSTPDATQSYEYQIWVNATSLGEYNERLLNNDGISGRYLSIQNAVDEGIIAHASGLDASLDASFGVFTRLRRDGDQDGKNQFLRVGGPNIISLGVTFASIVVLNLLVSEKQRKLVGLLRQIGVFESSHWLSWWISLLPLTLAAAAVTVAAGYIADLPIFTRADFLVHLILMWLFITSMFTSSICLASFLRQSKWVNLAALLAFVTVVTLVTLLSIFGFYEDMFKPTTPLAYRILTFPFPYVHYARVMVSMMDHIFPPQDESSVTTTTEQVIRYFSFSDLSQRGAPQFVTQNGARTLYRDPPPSVSLWYLLLDQIMFLLLAWYFGQVASGDLGASQKFYFPLSPYYWGLTKKSTEIPVGDTLAVVQAESLNTHSIITHKLSKSYANHTALTEVQLRIDNSKVTCILGENGAGKTTLVNCVSGLLDPTHGDAFVFGKSVREDVTSLRRYIGTCPQHDILWDELTSAQHMDVFLRLKRGFVASSEADKYSSNRLRDVNLWDVAHAPVNSFSGGMRRRLSLALSTVGEPNILILDEPTTGLDPISRRMVWRLVQRLKKDRIVILTTHSMEEADELGDHVAIMAHGKLRAVGDPLFLKNRFGSGYSLNIVTDPTRLDDVKQLVREHLPEAQIISGDTKSTMPSTIGPNAQNPRTAGTSVGGPGGYGAPAATPSAPASTTSEGPPAAAAASKSGSLSIAVPRSATARLPAFLRLLASSITEDGSGTLVKDYSISNSTLEEVFLKLASQNRGVNWVDDDAAQATISNQSRPLCLLCEDQPPELVTLYTGQSVSVEAPNLICLACSKRTAEEIHQLRTRLHGPAPVMESKIAEPAAVTPSTDAHLEVQGGGSGVRVAGAGAESGAGAGAGGIPPTSSSKPTSPARIPPSTEYTTVPVRPAGPAKHDDRPPVSFVEQFVAVGLLRLQLQARQKKTNICLIVTLVIVVFLVFISSSTPSLPDAPFCSNTGFYQQNSLCNASDWISEMQRVTDLPDQQSSARYMTCPGTTGGEANRDLTANSLNYPLCLEYGVDFGGRPECLRCTESSHTAFMQSVVVDGYIREIGTSLDDPGVVTQQVWFQNAPAGNDRLEDYNLIGIGAGNNFLNQTISFRNRDDLSDGIDAAVLQHQQEIREGQRTYDGCFSGSYNYIEGSQTDAANWMLQRFPSFAIEVDSADRSAASWAYTLRSYGRNTDNQYYDFNFAVSTEGCSWFSLNNGYGNPYDFPQYNELKTHTALNSINSAFLRSTTNTNASILTSFVNLPPVVYANQVRPEDTNLQTLLILIMLYLPFPEAVTYISGEKETLLFQMMAMAGLRSSAYWTASYLFSFAYSLFYTFLLFLFCFLLNIGFITANSFGVLFAVSLVWAHTLTCWGFLVGSVLRRTRTASIVSKASVAIFALLGNNLIAFVNTWPTWLLWMPTLGFVRALDILVSFGATSIKSGSELQEALIVSLVTGSIALLVGVYLHAVLKGNDPNSGVPLHPLFPLIAIRDRLCPRRASVTDVFSPKPLAALDPDVSAERDRVLSGQLPDDTVVAIRDLTLEFDSRVSAGKWYLPSCLEESQKFRAVDRLSLALGPGVFGLLGPNGAGKTSALNVLVGNLKATGGSAKLDGLDVNTDMHRIHRILGVCPQFDTVFPNLSVRQHLRFFARLKGVPSSQLKGTIQSTAERVQLDGDAFDKHSSSLSGGMRRRLSLGIALIGDPRCVVLDEPSTGLDPETRRAIWDIIQAEEAHGRCVIVTSHSMEEVEVLCPRIGIMVKGRLACVGSQHHLKSRFGEGYKLWMNLSINTPNVIATVDAWVKSVCPSAKQASQVGTSLSYNLPRGSVDIAELFQALEDYKESHRLITDTGLSNSSLETVFVQVVQKSDAADDPLKRGNRRRGSGSGGPAL